MLGNDDATAGPKHIHTSRHDPPYALGEGSAAIPNESAISLPLGCLAEERNSDGGSEVTGRITEKKVICSW